MNNNMFIQVLIWMSLILEPIIISHIKVEGKEDSVKEVSGIHPSLNLLPYP